VHSLRPSILANFALLSIFLAAAILSSLPPISSLHLLANLVWFSIFCLIPIYSLRKLVFRTVKRVEFYDHYFIVSGWNTNKRIKYTDIEKITPIKGKMIYLIPRTRLSISVRGEGWIRANLENPTNRKLKTDLYTWLLGKVRAKQP
jgi:hypothetical protein